MKSILIASLSITIAIMSSCSADKNSTTEANQEQAIFPIGQLGSASNFTGNAYNYGLVANDSIKLLCFII